MQHIILCYVDGVSYQVNAHTTTVEVLMLLLLPLILPTVIITVPERVMLWS